MRRFRYSGFDLSASENDHFRDGFRIRVLAVSAWLFGLPSACRIAGSDTPGLMPYKVDVQSGRWAENYLSTSVVRHSGLSQAAVSLWATMLLAYGLAGDRSGASVVPCIFRGTPRRTPRLRLSRGIRGVSTAQDPRTCGTGFRSSHATLWSSLRGGRRCKYQRVLGY